MKKSEAIETYREKIDSAMLRAYKSVLESRGRIEVQVYVWDDGEVVEFENVQGGNCWLQPKDWEDRDLFHVITISVPFFYPWDYTFETCPDDEEEREKAEAEIIDYLCYEYDSEIYYIINEKIREAKEEEEYREGWRDD